MTKNERLKSIKKELKNNKKIAISDLSEKLNVSEMTIRRDLRQLEEEGILTIIPKGAVLNTTNDFDKIDDTLKTRSLQNLLQKKTLAEYASKFIENGDIIFLDASTTVYEICPHIADKNITIITNSIRIAQYFSTNKNLTIILTGGILRYGTLSLIGDDTENTIKKYSINKVFMSAKAISEKHGITDVNMFEIKTKTTAISLSEEVFLLLDNTKINKTSLKQVCDIKDVTTLITNKISDLSEEQVKLFDYIKKNNIDLIFA